MEVQEILKDLFCDEKGKPSLTDVLAGLSFCLFAAVSLWLILRREAWPHFDTFANCTVGGGSLLKSVKYLAGTYAGVKSTTQIKGD
jgi:hypothetical protein